MLKFKIIVIGAVKVLGNIACVIYHFSFLTVLSFPPDCRRVVKGECSFPSYYTQGQWPTEEVLAYYSLSHVDSFRDKRVIELGLGYGLAGLAIAMATEAVEVVISDGNPQVVDCFVDICRQLKYLLTILVGCFHDFMPLVHGPSQLDLQSCDYMQFILQSIDIIARFLVEGISGSELNPKVIPTCEKRSMAAYSQIISPMTLKKL